jgi:streptogramin lyase
MRTARSLRRSLLVITALTVTGSLAGAGVASPTNAVVAADARPSQRVDGFRIPTRESQPIEIVLGPDGNVWFTEQNGSAIGRVDPRGRITEFRTPTFSFPEDVTAGPDGNVWFTEGTIGSIAVTTPAGGIREIPFSDFDGAGGITTGPDGNIWFTGITGNKVWRLDLATRELTDFDIPTPNSFPSAITAGADGNLWFLEGIGRLAKITTGGAITEFDEPLAIPFDITLGPDGNVWFVERFNQRIGKVTPDGSFTFYPTDLHTLETITPGFGQSLLFTSFADDSIAQITTDGVITPSAPVADSAPTGITRGPAKSVWVLGYGSNVVYRAVP